MSCHHPSESTSSQGVCWECEEAACVAELEVDAADLRRKLDAALADRTYAIAQMNKHWRAAQFWNGKWAIVKAENNALRRKLYRQRTEA